MSVNNRHYPGTAQVLNLHWSASITFPKTHNRKRKPEQNVHRNTDTLWTVAENGRQETWCRKEKVLMTPNATPLLLSLVTHSHLQFSGIKPPFPSPTSNAHTTLWTATDHKSCQCSLNSARNCKFYYLSLMYTELLLPLIWSWLYGICYTVQYIVHYNPLSTWINSIRKIF